MLMKTNSAHVSSAAAVSDTIILLKGHAVLLLLICVTFSYLHVNETEKNPFLVLTFYIKVI